ncbi:MAG: biotin carboxylase N-terminal domain-containing protein [Myxococcota bacterium]
MFQRLFIANRGEVAVRIARTCDAIGLVPVFGVSAADRDAPYLRGRETVLLGPSRASESYLDPVRLVQAAIQSGCSALHPGWGFLSESSRFARLVEQHGLTFVGPPADVMAQMGCKIPAKQAMREAGLEVIPGSAGTLKNFSEAQQVADEVGYPVLIKADRGGGGRGMRVAETPAELKRAYEDAIAEAASAFGDSRVYLEKLMQAGRHVEIQLMADRYGHVVHLGERDCTIQRNHQKLLEESPAPTLSQAERTRTLEAAVSATRRMGYVGAGTMEFLLDPEGTLRFMEMNTRLQVEHGVTEMRCGLDLVDTQLRVAAGQKLPLSQSQIELSGHVIECRINAEDPEDDFRPVPGVVKRFVTPSFEGVRVDTHIASGSEISPFYDSLLCKLLTFGATRREAAQRMSRALSELVVEGVSTTASMHAAVVRSESFLFGSYHTGMIPGWRAQDLEAEPGGHSEDATPDGRISET